MLHHDGFGHVRRLRSSAETVTRNPRFRAYHSEIFGASATYSAKNVPCALQAAESFTGGAFGVCAKAAATKSNQHKPTRPVADMPSCGEFRLAHQHPRGQLCGGNTRLALGSNAANVCRSIFIRRLRRTWVGKVPRLIRNPNPRGHFAVHLGE
jgi:hypothetical protein